MTSFNPILDEIDSKDAYDHYLPQAQDLDPAFVQPFRGDALLAHHNVRTGVLNVLQHANEVSQALPQVSIDIIKALPALAMAVVFAAKQVNRLPETTELHTLYPRVTVLRRKLLATATALASGGMLPDRDVEAIRRGKGKIDAATDLIQLASLFDRYSKEVENKHAIAADEIKEASALGTRVLTILKPSNAPRNTPISPTLAAAVENRDRLWTLLLQGYTDHLWRAGAWLFQSDVDAHVVPLLSRVVRHSAQLPLPATTPESPASQLASHGQS